MCVYMYLSPTPKHTGVLTITNSFYDNNTFVIIIKPVLRTQNHLKATVGFKVLHILWLLTNLK